MDPSVDALIEELKLKLIRALNLHIGAAEIDPDQPMMGAGLGIDSIDALELMVMVEKDYGVKIENRESGIEAFRSVRSLAEYIRTRRSTP